MNNTEDMMILWKQMDNKLTALTEENKRMAREIKTNRFRTGLERLSRKYRCFIILEAVAIPLMFLALVPNPLVLDKYRWITLAYFVCFFIMEIVFDTYLLMKLNDFDIYSDSIADIASKARNNWKIHKIAVLVGIPVAIGAVILFCLAVGGNEATLYGVAVGAIIGLAIGLNEFFKFMKNYKSLSD